MRKYIFIVVVLLSIAVLLPGCSILQKLGISKPDNDELRPVSSVVMGEDQARQLENKIPIHLYFSNADNTKLGLEIRYIDIAEAEKGSSYLGSTIVNELVKGPASRTGLKATIPDGTELKNLTIKGGVATVDFNKEFVDNHPGGKTAEQLTLYSIVNSLTELKDITKVKFTIDGKSQKEYKGSFKFDTSFPRNTSMISKTPASSSIIDDGEESVETDADIEDEVLE